MPAWGVFITTPRERHVMPVDHEGYAIDAHVPQLWCWCRPRLDPFDQRIVVHFDATEVD